MKKKTYRYRCSRCQSIFETKRHYTNVHSPKICDKCLKPKNSNKNKKLTSPYRRIIKKSSK